MSKSVAGYLGEWQPTGGLAPKLTKISVLKKVLNALVSQKKVDSVADRKQ